MKQHMMLATLFLLICGGCDRLKNVGKAPDLTSNSGGREQIAMLSPGMPLHAEKMRRHSPSSLWEGGRGSLLGDRRAQNQGDILTVVIEIDDSAEISNSTQRSRSGSQSMGIPQFFGIPQRIDTRLPAGASLADAVATSSSSGSSGDGSVSRNERLTLRIAATIIGRLPNGVLQIQGSQEVRVNFELRELMVSGFVRPEDISRQNEITYDKIASARISYGGRGQITDLQQPRYGQQITDIILPF